MKRFVLLFIIVFLLVPTSVFAQQTYQTSQTTTTDVGKPTAPSCANTNDCVAKIKQLGFSIGGNTPQDWTMRTYGTLALMAQKAPNFIRLLKLSSDNVSITLHADGGCAGHADYGGIDLYGPCRGTVVDRFLVLHELGHVIAFRNSSLFSKFYYANVWAKDVLPTFNCQLDYTRFGYQGPYPGECWADMIGEYPIYQQYRITVSGQPSYKYPTFPDFPSFANGYYYGFARTNIFNGAIF